MPQRKNNNSIIKKQKKLIENRLIQISMVVDDYIYQNKPISSSIAEMYMREVHYYKDKCFEDERFLQVIEKLIRFMIGIITEQGDKGINVDDLNYLPSANPIHNVLENLSQSTQNSKLNTPKSTKSVPNFRTYGNKNKKIYRDVINTRGSAKKTKKASISQDSDIFNLSIDSDPGYNMNLSQNNENSRLKSLKVKIGTNVKNYSNKNKKMYRYITNATDELQNTDIVDLCKDSDEEHNNVMGSQNYDNNFNKKALLQRDLPTLSINVNELTPTVVSDEPNLVPDDLIPNMVSEEFSQSILTGFHHETESMSKLNKEYLNNIVSKPKPQHTEVTYRQTVTQEIFTNDKKDTHVTSTQSQQYKEPVINEKVHENITTIKNDKTNNNFNKKYNNLTAKVTSDNLPPKNILESSTNCNTRYKKQKNAKINNTDQVKVRKPRTKKQNFNNNTFTEEKSKNYPKNVVNTVNIHDNTTTDKTANFNNPSISRSNQNKADKKTKNNSKKTKVAPISNNLIVNDLSWVEDIKYVREVAKDEYESVILGDNFWENFSLPDNWNDNDFLYSTITKYYIY